AALKLSSRDGIILSDELIKIRTSPAYKLQLEHGIDGLNFVSILYEASSFRCSPSSPSSPSFSYSPCSSSSSSSSYSLSKWRSRLKFRDIETAQVVKGFQSLGLRNIGQLAVLPEDDVRRFPAQLKISRGDGKMLSKEVTKLRERPKYKLKLEHGVAKLELIGILFKHREFAIIHCLDIKKQEEFILKIIRRTS